MKKLAAVLLAASLLPLWGCGVRPVELSGRLIIEAVGVDKTDDGFTVTAQALDSLAVGVDVGVPDSGVTRCYTFHGTTVSEALQQAAAQTGLSSLYSQTRLLVVGFPTARKDLPGTLDFFLREPGVRSDVLFAVAEHTAAELVTASFGKNRVGADVLEDALRSGEETGDALSVPLYGFLNLLYGDTDAACCPLVGVKENPLTGDSLVQPLGSVIFRGTEIGTVISSDEALPLRLLTGQTGSAELTVPLEQGRCALRLTRGKTTVRLTGGADLSFRVTIGAKCDITELDAEGADALTPERIRSIADAAEAYLAEAAAALLDRCFYRDGCDICRFFKRFRLLRPARYRAMAASLCPADVTCEIECRVTVNRTGKEILKGG